ncbi:MAG: RNA 2',3'-cyclic phosphodiesterase [Patescibacteria group bacterium]
MRLFIAITVPNGLHNYCQQMQWRFEGLKKVNAFHLTLQFLGDDTKDPEPIMAALSQIQFKPFEIEMGDIVPFGPPTEPRGVWIECAKNKALNALAAEIQAALKLLGYKSDKPFMAHITLGRYKRFPGKVPQRAKGVPHHFMADHFELIQSHLGENGPQYKVLQKFFGKPQK